MSRSVLVCDDPGQSKDLISALYQDGRVGVSTIVRLSLTSLDLKTLLRRHAPHVVFIHSDTVEAAAVAAAAAAAAGAPAIGFGAALDAPALLALMRAGIQDFLRQPVEQNELAAVLTKVIAASRVPAGRLVSFLPAKGGVGASTVAANVALAAGRSGAPKVLLVDFDTGSGIQRFLLNGRAPLGVVEAARSVNELRPDSWSRMVTAIDGVDLLDAGKPEIGRTLEPGGVSALLAYLQRHYPLLCADLAAGLDAAQFRVAEHSDSVYLVVTPEIPALFQARERIGTLRERGIDNRTRVLLNRYDKRSLLPLPEIEKLLGVQVEVTFPNAYAEVSRSLAGTRGLPSDSELGRCYADFAARVFLEPLPVETSAAHAT